MLNPKIECLIQKVLLRQNGIPQKKNGQAFAPSNIALCKYWGKRDFDLNLPNTNSLSIALGSKGTTTQVEISKDKTADQIYLNGKILDPTDPFSKRLSSFLNYFRFASNVYYVVHTQSNIPIGAGVASSASGFAAMVLALSDLYNWDLSLEALSILARLGSGSAARSLYTGFVEWEEGVDPIGGDSVAKPLNITWPNLKIGLCLFDKTQKKISSRIAMQRSVETSKYYKLWPEKVSEDLSQLKKAIFEKAFRKLGEISESNSLNMHALMHTSWPPICYDLPETLAAKHKVLALRSKGVEVYFTQDAGPNLKLLFLKPDLEVLQNVFKSMEVISPF